MLVVGVSPGGPVASAGGRRGDVVVGIGDVPERDLSHLQGAPTTRFRPGETVPLCSPRDGAIAA